MISVVRRSSVVEQLLWRDRLVVFTSLSILTILAWVYLYYITTLMDMSTLAMSDMIKPTPWTAIDALFMFLMWAVMMLGMMLPSATPVILLYVRVVRHSAKDCEPLIHTSAFLGGYLVVWTAFSAVATILQFVLEQATLLSPMMTSLSPVVAGLLLIVVAIYQWTPYKGACLQRCRSPVWFISTYWRAGSNGAFQMGLIHGAYCLGCCWALMMLLFVGGVMNLLFIAAITLFVVVEKLLSQGRLIGRVAGVFIGLLGIILVVG